MHMRPAGKKKCGTFQIHGQRGWVEQVGASRLAAATPAGSCVPEGCQSQCHRGLDRVLGCWLWSSKPLALGIIAVSPALGPAGYALLPDGVPMQSEPSLELLCALAGVRKVHKLWNLLLHSVSAQETASTQVPAMPTRGSRGQCGSRDTVEEVTGPVASLVIRPGLSGWVWALSCLHLGHTCAPNFQAWRPHICPGALAHGSA